MIVQRIQKSQTAHACKTSLAIYSKLLSHLSITAFWLVPDQALPFRYIYTFVLPMTSASSNTLSDLLIPLCVAFGQSCVFRFVILGLNGNPCFVQHLVGVTTFAICNTCSLQTKSQRYVRLAGSIRITLSGLHLSCLHHARWFKVVMRRLSTSYHHDHYGLLPASPNGRLHRFALKRLIFQCYRL